MSDIEKKKWKVRTSDNSREISFFPVFEVNKLAPGETKIAGNKEVECKFIDVEMNDNEGRKVEMRLGFQELYMFIYYCANEELRQQLMLRYERHITNIPYEVSFTIDEEEKAKGIAKRLITLPVDEITMAIARSEAQALEGRATLGSIEEWFHKKRLSKKLKTKQ